MDTTTARDARNETNTNIHNYSSPFPPTPLRTPIHPLLREFQYLYTHPPRGVREVFSPKLVGGSGRVNKSNQIKSNQIKLSLPTEVWLRIIFFCDLPTKICIGSSSSFFRACLLDVAAWIAPSPNHLPL
jgi:hypothetical protein